MGGGRRGAGRSVARGVLAGSGWARVSEKNESHIAVLRSRFRIVGDFQRHDSMLGSGFARNA